MQRSPRLLMEKVAPNVMTSRSHGEPVGGSTCPFTHPAARVHPPRWRAPGRILPRWRRLRPSWPASQ
jgi:hypothetical protein